MQRYSTVRILLRSLGAVALVAALLTPAEANGPSPEYRGSRDWMPDVRERVLDLRERTKLATEESRARRHEDAAQGQWWRAVAARPSHEVTR